jgi:hypothetical protein
MALQRPTRTRATNQPARDPNVMGDHEVPDDLETAILSYEDAVRYLRRQKLVCRGPIPDARRAEVTKLLRAGKRDAANALAAEHRGVRNRSTGELEPCGYDYVDMIVETKHPLDGSKLAYQCPKCGVTGELQPAFLNVEDRPSAKAHAALREKFLTKANAAHEARKRVAATRAE